VSTPASAEHDLTLSQGATTGGERAVRPGTASPPFDVRRA
jgi:hypothetical protein